MTVALGALKDGGKHSKMEQKEAITRKIVDWIRDVGFRTTKFAKGNALDRFVGRVFDAIKDDLDLLNEDTDHYTTGEEFKRIYTAFIQKTLGDRRQYVQTQILKAFIGKSFLCVHAQNSVYLTLNFGPQTQFILRRKKLCPLSSSFRIQLD